MKINFIYRYYKTSELVRERDATRLIKENEKHLKCAWQH